VDNSTVEVVLKINAQQFEQGVKNATRVYASSTQDIAGINTTASNSMGSLTRKVLKLGAAYLTVSNSIALVKQLLATGGNFESLRIQLETLTGSALAGEQAFDWIKAFVKETPFGLDDVTEGFIKLKAFGLDPMDGSYQAIADQAAALGGGQEKLNGIILAVGQAWAKQKLQGEEILQLVERGVPVWDLLAQATGRTNAELQDMSASGELGREVIAKLVAEMGKGVDGAALKQVETWNGLVSNAQVEWQQFLDTIAQSGSLDFFKEELTDLLAEIERLAASGELQEYAEEVGEAIVNLAKVLGSVVGFIVRFNDEIVLLGKVLIVGQLLKYASGLYSIAAGALAATSATTKLSRATRILKATATLGLTLALDAAISKYLEMDDAANDAADGVNKASDEITKAQEEIRKENERLNKEGVANALSKQAAIHADYAEKIKQAKQTETTAIKNELAAQLKAYDTHLKGLEDAKKRQVDIAKEFADLINELRTGSGQEVEQPDILDFASAITNARQALNNGDYEGAIDGAEGLAEMIRTMRDNGTEADIVLQGLAQQAADLANEAAGKRVEQEASQLEKAQQSIDKLITRAEFLKHIELGFDQALADKNLTDIQQILQQKLNQNPLVMSINLAQGVDLKQAEGLLEKVGVNPLVPNVEQLPDNTTPIIRPLQLDTSEAERQINAITEQAAKPVVKELYVNAAGNSFSDRQSSTNAVFKDEALQKGRRL
jgi:tape measure domain-containing protein